MKSAHFPLFHVLGVKAPEVTAGTGPEQERGSARRPPYGGGGPAGGVLLSCLPPHSTFQRVRAGKPPLHSNITTTGVESPISHAPGACARPGIPRGVPGSLGFYQGASWLARILPRGRILNALWTRAHSKCVLGCILPKCLLGHGCLFVCLLSVRVTFELFVVRPGQQRAPVVES